MSYKLQRCRKCSYKRAEAKPKKPGACPKCGGETYYSEAWYYCLYHKGKKIEKSGGPNKIMADDKERQAKLDRSSGKLEKKALTWDHGVRNLRGTYLIIEVCPNGHTRPGEPGKPKGCDTCEAKTEYVYRGLSGKTIAMYEGCLKVLTPYFRDWKLHEIDEGVIQQYKLHRYSHGVGPSSVNRDLSTISRILGLSGFKDVKVVKDAETKRDRYLKPDEFVSFLKTVENPDIKPQVKQFFRMLKMITHIILDTGLRKTATLSLMKGDFDFNLRVVKKEGKGGKESTVPLTDRLIDELKTYMGEAGITDDHQYLFPSPVNPGSHVKEIKRSFKKVLDEAGIKDVRLHDLRRTFGAYFADGTGDIKALQNLLQHSDIKLTNDVYSPFLDNKLHARMGEFEEKTGHLWSKTKVKQEIPEDLKKQLVSMGWQPPV